MRVVYVILSCEAYLPTRGHAIRETWFQDVRSAWFISAKEDRSSRVLGWSTGDSYTDCASKYAAFFHNERLETDWIVFVDDDTFVYPDRLEAYLATLDPTQRIQCGYCFRGNRPSDMSGGAGICISGALYRILCTQAPPTPPSSYSDVFLSQLTSRIPDVQFVSDHRFHWRNARTISEQRTAFTFHYVSPQQMYTLYRERDARPTMDVSILIPTMKPRERLFRQVLTEIQKQASECPQIRTEILWESDNGELTLGQKRNVLVDRCSGQYHCFIDDDDVLAPDYLKTFVPMLTSGLDYDCASFVGAHYQKGTFTKLFHHSLRHTEWAETPERYIRTISPMNLIKTDIVRQVRYKDIRNTEDHEFSKRLMASGLLKTEYEINPTHPIYHYVDGVKADREQWQYEWQGEYLRLFKSPILGLDTYAVRQPTASYTPLSFLRISR